jgi:subfamily B ATP-binding cassette protein HlyB/CyaB
LTGFACCAREQGLDAKLVALRAGDLAYVRVGSIIEFDDESLAIVTSHRHEAVEVDDASGNRRDVSVDDEAQPVMALEIGPPAPAVPFFKRLVDRLRAEPHVKRAVRFSAVLALVLAGLGIAGPLFTRLAFGLAIPDRASSQLTLIAVGVVVVGLQTLYVATLRRAALVYLSLKFSEKASTDLVAQMLRLPLSSLSAMDLGTVRQAVASASTAAEAVPSTLVPPVVDGLLGLGFLVLTFVLDPRSGLVATIGGVLVIVAGYFSGRRRLALRRNLLTRRRAQLQVLYEAFSGIETVKSENVEGRMLARWLDRVLAEEQSSRQLRLETSRVDAIMDVVGRMTFAAVLLFTAKRCLDGVGTLADLVAAVQASTSFMGAATKLARVADVLADYLGDAERVDEMFQQPIESDDGARHPADTTRPAVALRDVWFRYEDDAPWVLVGAHLVVEAGERLILSWPSGAGKSTLLRILAGLVAPTRGDALLFGGEATRSRRLVTYIPQQATLFQASVVDNLRILSGNARPERILAAAEATGLMEMVSGWAMGIETRISAGVVNVSSGQRQLILFTAAVASEAPIVLLDEALAHMDLDMRGRLGATDFFRGRTVISVVHDVSKAEESGCRVVSLEALRAPAGLLTG